MRKVKIFPIDDIDGSEADRTVRFGLNGTSCEIDLNESNSARLEGTLAQFTEKAKKVTSGRGVGRAGGAAGRSRSQSVRVWAKDQGIPVPFPVRGRVPNHVVEQYKTANQ